MTITKGIVGFLGVVIIGSTAFYFTTSNRLSNLETRTETLSKDKADKNVMESELINIKGSLTRIETKLDKK